MLTKQKILNTLTAINSNCSKNNWDKLGSHGIKAEATEGVYLFLFYGRAHSPDGTVSFTFEGHNYLVRYMYPGLNGHVVFEALDVLTNKEFEIHCYSAREIIFFNVTEKEDDLGKGMA